MAQVIPQPETALAVQSTPPVIVFDFEAAKAAVKASLEKYNGLVVSEDTTVEIKKDMADLNKQKAALADAAKEAVKAVSAPLDVFKGQVKELTGLFEETYKSLGEKVKFFEDKQREERRKYVQEAIKEAMEQEGVSFEIPIQDKWLNKSTPRTTIKAAVYDIIDAHKAAEAQKKALEQAGKDRAAAIEAHVNGQNAMLGLKVPVSHYMIAEYLNIETPLQDVLTGITEGMKAAKSRQEQQAAATAQPTPEPAQEQVQAQPELQPVTEPLRTASLSAPAQAATDTVSMIVCLEYSPANEKSVAALLDALEKQCVTFSKRVKNQ